MGISFEHAVIITNIISLLRGCYKLSLLKSVGGGGGGGGNSMIGRGHQELIV